MTFLLSKECIELSRADCDPADHPAASEVITVSSESEVRGHDHFLFRKAFIVLFQEQLDALKQVFHGLLLPSTV